MAASTNIPEIDKTEEIQGLLREPKTFAVTPFKELAAKAEAMAAQEGQEVSDLLVHAFLQYYGDVVFHSLKEVREYAATRHPRGHTEEDVPCLIKELRGRAGGGRS